LFHRMPINVNHQRNLAGCQQLHQKGLATGYPRGATPGPPSYA
jgi:hypothetical protein